VAAEDLDGAHHGPARGLVLVEEVPPQQHHVGAVVPRELEDLLERLKGIVLADLVLLPDALGGEEARRGERG
jgi:hypothetical protein